MRKLYVHRDIYIYSLNIKIADEKKLSTNDLQQFFYPKHSKLTFMFFLPIFREYFGFLVGAREGGCLCVCVSLTIKYQQESSSLQRIASHIQKSMFWLTKRFDTHHPVGSHTSTWNSLSTQGSNPSTPHALHIHSASIYTRPSTKNIWTVQSGWLL